MVFLVDCFCCSFFLLNKLRTVHNVLLLFGDNSEPSCRKQVEEGVISCVVKARLRSALETLQKDVYTAKSKMLMDHVDRQIVLLKQVRPTIFGSN